MARVAVVTDSTAYLPRTSVDEYGIGVVPLFVVLGDDAGAEGSEVTPAVVAAALAARRRVTTTRPTPRAFARAYEEAVARGATTVVSVHLSARLSGTCEAARLGASRVDVRVEVVDSGSVAMGLGFAALAAAKVAVGGGTLEEVADIARRQALVTRSFFYVDTLEHLRRGGRVTARQALVGTALSVKPILHVADGAIALLEKVRTTSKALARLEEHAVQAADGKVVDVAVHHLAQPERAEALVGGLRRRLAYGSQVVAVEVGAVIAAHTGPGLLGVVVSPQ